MDFEGTHQPLPPVVLMLLGVAPSAVTKGLMHIRNVIPFSHMQYSYNSTTFHRNNLSSLLYLKFSLIKKITHLVVIKYYLNHLCTNFFKCMLS